MTRPNDFDPTTPTAGSSPRDGDDEIRKVKLWTQNGWNDLTGTDRSVAGRETHPLYATTLNASGGYTGTVNVTANNSSNITAYPTFVTSTTGQGQHQTDTGFTYNPSTGSLVASSFSGALTGNVTGDVTGTASAATQVAAVTTDTNTTHYLTFVNSDNSTAQQETIFTDESATYNPSTGALAATSFTGALTGDVTGNVTGDLTGDVTGDVSGNAGTADQVKTQSRSTNASHFIAFTDSNNSSAGNETIYTAAGISVNPSTSTVTATTFSGALSGHATSSGQVNTVTSDNNSTHHITFVTDDNSTATAETVNTDESLTYNPSTGALAATSFTGSVTGNASSASAVSTISRSTNATHYLTFVTDNNSSATNESVYTDAGLTYNPSTNLLGTNTSGNAATATALATARTIALSGDVSGSVSFDGTGNVSISTTLEADTTPGTVQNAVRVQTQTRDTNATHYLAFVDSDNSSASNESVYTDESLTYNPSTGALSATSFTGTVSGTVTNANNIRTQSRSTNATHFVTFVDSNNSSAANEALYTDAGIGYNPSTNLLSVNTSGNVTVGSSDTFSLDGTSVTATGAELNILDGVTATATEINALDGITATASELNWLDGLTDSSSNNNELYIFRNSSGQKSVFNIAYGNGLHQSSFSNNTKTVAVQLNGSTLTNSSSGLSVTNPLTTGSQTIAGAKTFSGNATFQGNVALGNATGDTISYQGTDLTVTAADINKLASVDASASELNLLDGVTATTTEINRLDLASSTYLGIFKIEADSSNADPVAADFTGNVNLILQY